MNLERIPYGEAKVVSSLDSEINALSKKLGAIFSLGSDRQTILAKASKTLVRSCWKDMAAVNSIFKKLSKNTEASSIWSAKNGTSKIASVRTEKECLEFLTQCLKAVLAQNLKVAEYVQKTQREFVKLLKSVIYPSLIAKDEEEKQSKAEEAKQLLDSSLE